LGNSLGLSWSLGGDGVLEGLSGDTLGLEVVEDGGALAVAGKLVSNRLQVRESGVQGGLESLDVAGDSNGVGEGELRSRRDLASTGGGGGLDLLGGRDELAGISRVGLDGGVKVLEVRCDGGEDCVDGITSSSGDGRASKGDEGSSCISHFDVLFFVFV